MNKETKLLKKQNNALICNLNLENKTFLKNMQTYLINQNITRNDFEKVKYDIINILYDAQLNGLSCKNVVGNDYKLFCDELLQEIPKIPNKLKYLRFYQKLVMILILILCFIPLETLFYESSISNLVVKYFHLFTILLCSLFIYLMTRISKKAFLEDYPIYEIIVLFIYNILYQLFKANTFMQTVLFQVNIYVLIFIIMFLILIYKYIDDRI